MTCLEKCSLPLNVLYRDPCETPFLRGDFPQQFGYIMFILFLFRSKQRTENKERSTFSHQATFEANWVCRSNSFATGQSGESTMMEIELPHVATECYWHVVFYFQSARRHWRSERVEAPGGSVEDPRESLWPQRSRWGRMYIVLKVCFCVHMHMLGENMNSKSMFCLLQPLWWSCGIGSWRNHSSQWTSTSSVSVTVTTLWRPSLWFSLCPNSTGWCSVTSSTSCR